MNLLESKTLHHVTDVLVVQVLAKGRILSLLHMVEVELEHVGSLRKSASGWLSEDLIQGKYDGIVAVPFMLLLFGTVSIFLKIVVVYILFCRFQRSLSKSVGEHLAMKSVKGEPRCQPLALIMC